MNWSPLQAPAGRLSRSVDPPSFLCVLLVLLKPLVRGTSSINLVEALTVVGKAGRLAQIVREARPFSGALYAAYQASSRRLRAKLHAAASKWLLGG